MVGSPHIHMPVWKGGGLAGGHGAGAGVEEHTLNLMPKAPSFYNFFSPGGLAYTHTQIHTCTFVEAQRTETRLLLKRNNDCAGLGGDWVAWGAWEEVRCTVYLLCLSILI